MKRKSFSASTPEAAETKMRLGRGEFLLEDLQDVDGEIADSVYFIQASTGGPIKIGYANNIHKRLRVIQACCPVPLQVLHVIQGADRRAENILHKRFAPYRLHGEWFDNVPELLQYIYEQKTAKKKKK